MNPQPIVSFASLFLICVLAMGCKFPYPGDFIPDAATDAAPADTPDAGLPPTWAILAVHSSPSTPATEPVRLYRPDANGRYVSTWTSTELDFGTSAAVADVDGDNDLDVAVGNWAIGIAARNRIYRNDGGTFSLTWASERTTTWALEWSDVDRDGDPDLVDGSSAGVFIYRNTNGRLELPIQIVVDGAFDLDLGDIDGDGDPDLIVADNPGEPGALYTNDGTGRFQSVPWNGPADEVSVRFGDYDADGDLDVAVGRTQGFSIYRAEGTTMLYAFGASELRPAFNARSNVEWIDYDGDGDLDLVAGHCTPLFNAPCAATPVTIYQNLGASFAVGWTSPTVDKTTSVAVGDFNNDGRPDLVFGNDGAPLRLYENTGGGFALAWSSVEREHTTAVAWVQLAQ